MTWQVREARAVDYPAIFDTVAASFGRPEEARLVEALRRSGALTLDLVAEVDGRIVGHIALSRLLSPGAALALAPLSVHPDHQRIGVGHALMRAAIERAEAAEAEMIFVLGDPAYYGRFGFETRLAAPYESPFQGPYFMARAVGRKLPPPAAVIYPAPFDDLG